MEKKKLCYKIHNYTVGDINYNTHVIVNVAVYNVAILYNRNALPLQKILIHYYMYDTITVQR